MSRITILQPGMMMTVQDAGRHGLLRFGVSRSGAMDPDAMVVANALVGNPAGAAVLEFAQFGGSLTLDEDRVIAACGDLFALRINKTPVRPWESHLLRKGDELSLGPMRETVWGYLAISGGIAADPVLGARATHLRSRLGGHEGRVLVKEDRLPLGEPLSGARAGHRLSRPWRGRAGAIHVVMGPQDDYFAPETIACFLSAPYRIGTKRDRMALVLEGPELPARKGHDIVSDGTLAGSIQVPGAGLPIVLMADRQTTGGYPKIATIASVDLARLGQMPSGRAFRFRKIGADHAEELLIARQKALALALEDLDPAKVGAPVGASPRPFSAG
ncbi:MAG: biotin-dependent carboxyltransferase family protein [Paracoccus sp. (in: a-proteobacteria)]|uniref:5-oxoprolinase subunit C family protein n=1 Tax=Paracoccus sp. TaxID=267 RepID=UPI0039E271B2